MTSQRLTCSTCRDAVRSEARSGPLFNECAGGWDTNRRECDREEESSQRSVTQRSVLPAQTDAPGSSESKSCGGTEEERPERGKEREGRREKTESGWVREQIRLARPGARHERCYGGAERSLSSTHSVGTRSNDTSVERPNLRGLGPRLGACHWGVALFSVSTFPLEKQPRPSGKFVPTFLVQVWRPIACRQTYRQPDRT